MRRSVQVLCLAAAAGSTSAAPCVDYSTRTSDVQAIVTPNQARTLDVVGEWLHIQEFVGSHGDARYALYDASDPANPTFASGVELPDGSGQIAMHGSTVYLAAGALSMIDVSDPTSIRLADQLMPDGHARSVALYGTTLYVGNGAESGGIDIFDVSEPLAPVHVGHRSIVSQAVALFAYEGHLYVSTENDVHVATLADPEKPTLVGSLEHGRDAHRFHVHESTMYVTANHTLFAHDVSDPAAPEFIGFVEAWDGYPVATTAGERMYVSSGARVFETAPGHIDAPIEGPMWYSCVFGCCIPDIAAKDGHVHVSHWYDGVGIVHPASYPPPPLSIVEREARALLAIGDDVFVASHEGVEWFDLADPTQPTSLRHLDAVDDVRDFEIVPPYILGIADHRLIVLDGTSPDAFGVLGEVETDGLILSTTVANGRLFAVSSSPYAKYESRLAAYDVDSDPSRPASVWHDDFTHGPGEIAAHGSVLVVSEAPPYRHRIVAFDVSNPDLPVFAWPGPEVDVVDDLALHADVLCVRSHDRIEFFDIRDPKAIVSTNTFALNLTCDDGRGMQIDGDVLFASDGSLRLFDLSDAGHPVLLGDAGPGLHAGVQTSQALLAPSWLDYEIRVLPRHCAASTPIGPAGDATPPVPDADALSVRPNPFSSAATVQFAVGEPSDIVLETFDVVGRRLSTRSLGRRPAGRHSTRLTTPELPATASVVFVRVSASGHEVGVVKLIRAD